MSAPLAGRLRKPTWRLRVGYGVAVAVVGVLFAAAAARRGGFLARDVDVAPPPLDFGGRRLDLSFDGWGGRWRIPALPWLGRTVELLLQALLAIIVIAVAVAVGYQVVRGLLAIRSLLLRRVAATEVPEAYDAGELTDEDAETALRARLSRAVGVGEETLDELTDPADAVLACYVAMERAVAAAGTGRRAFETPHDLLRRVLEEQAVSAQNAGELTGLYEQVRYGARRPDESMRERARGCLQAIRAELGAVR